MDKSNQNVTASELLRNLVSVITYMVDLHDPTASSHQEEVALLAGGIAEAMGYDEKLIDRVFLAGQIHDVGKIAVPAEVLGYPGKLNHEQQMLVVRHPQVGYEILKPIRFPFNLAEIVYQHHERLDGSGYPMGLSGSQILPESRILAVADVVQAMLTNRSYHEPCSVESVLEELEAHKGSLYDTDVVNAYKKLVAERGPAIGRGNGRQNN